MPPARKVRAGHVTGEDIRNYGTEPPQSGLPAAMRGALESRWTANHWG